MKSIKNAYAENRMSRRSAVVFLLIAVFAIVEIYMLYRHTAIVEGVDKRTDSYKREAIAMCNRRTIIPGDILDCNGTVLVENKKVGEPGVYADDYAYSQVLGYLQNGGYRFQKLAEDMLYGTKRIEDTKGNSIQVNIDHGLQEKTAEILANEIGGIDHIGSLVILDAKTGQVLTMLSYPSFNANELTSSITAMDATDPALEIRYPMAYKNGKAPGSVFKAVTLMAALENGMGEKEYEDSSYMAGDYTVKNAYGNIGDWIDLKTALVRSSNCVMAQAAQELGAKKLTEMAEKCMIGKEVELDFGTLTSNWEVDDSDQEVLCQTGFGQGKVLTSTMNMAMISQAIANDGVMLRPYLIKRILSNDGEVVKEGDSEALSEVCAPETAHAVKDAMRDAAQEYKSQADARTQMLTEQYQICCKTGTSENGDEEGTNNAWMISFAPWEDPRYVVVANQIKCQKHGADLLDSIAETYQYLFEEM